MNTDFKTFSKIGMIIVIVLCVFFKHHDSNRQKKEIDRLKTELARARTHMPVERIVFRDSLTATTAPVTAVSKSAYKNNLADRQMLKDLGVKASQITAQETRVSQTSDTVKGTVTDSVFTYRDKWAYFRLSIPDTTLQYSIRDSLATFIVREYKHRFLWWRWGTRGYKVKVVSFNPHTILLYDNYIKVE